MTPSYAESIMAEEGQSGSHGAGHGKLLLGKRRHIPILSDRLVSLGTTYWRRIYRLDFDEFGGYSRMSPKSVDVFAMLSNGLARHGREPTIIAIYTCLYSPLIPIHRSSLHRSVE